MSRFAEAERLLALEPEGAGPPRRDPSRVRALEQRLAIVCPPSIRDWYERDDATTVLGDYSNCDRPVATEDMQLVGNHVVFLVENQGVCRWAFRIDGRDDPEVVVRHDDEPWESCGCGFAAFIAAQVFDWAEGWAADSRRLAGDPLDERALAWLAERFQPGPVARQRRCSTHRFFDQRSRITILDDVWSVRSASFDEMDRLLEVLQPFYRDEW